MGIKHDPTTGLPSNDNSSYEELLQMWREEKKKRQEAENEVTLIKGIGQNSPEVKRLKEDVNSDMSVCINNEKDREEIISFLLRDGDD